MGSKKDIGRARRTWQRHVAPSLRGRDTMEEYAAVAETTIKQGKELSEDRHAGIMAVLGWMDNGKVTYQADPDLVSELLATDFPDGFVPYDVFRHRPHLNPYIALPEPMKVPITVTDDIYSGHNPDLMGSTIHIVYEGFVIMTSKYSRGTNLSCVWFGRETHSMQTVAVTYHMPLSPYIMVNMDHGLAGMTDDDLIVASTDDGIDLHKYVRILSGDFGVNLAVIDPQVNLSKQDEYTITQSVMRPAIWHGIKDVVTLSLNMLLYLSADNMDLGPIAAPHVGGRVVPGTTKLDPHELGYRVGTALRKARTTTRATGSEPTGRGVTPHIRRAHWHRFWTGPRNGDRKLVVRWINQTLVNADHESDTTMTIRPIRQAS